MQYFLEKAEQNWKRCALCIDVGESVADSLISDRNLEKLVYEVRLKELTNISCTEILPFFRSI